MLIKQFNILEVFVYRMVSQKGSQNNYLLFSLPFILTKHLAKGLYSVFKKPLFMLELDNLFRSILSLEG